MYNKKQTPPDLTAVLNNLKVDIFHSLNCAQVGIIQSFDAAKQTARVLLALKQIERVNTDGVRTLSDYALLVDCPVFFPQGGGFSLTFPIAKGDECLVVFSDRCIDNWLANGVGQQPACPRSHDLSDGFAFVGVRSNPRALSDVSTTATELRSDDKATYIQLENDKATVYAPKVDVHASQVYQWDVFGYGQKFDYDGAGNWTITNYTTPKGGQTVTSVNANIDDPRIPQP